MVLASIATLIAILGVVVALRPLSGTHGAVVLGEASARGSPTLVRLALALGADPNTSGDALGPPLFRAAANCRREVAVLLLERGANAEVVTSLGRTALNAALGCRGSVAVALARLMVDNGALEVERRWGNPMAEIRWGDTGPDLVRLLHDSGVAPDEPLHDGTTPLQFFIGERASSIIDALLAIGADPERIDSHGKTPLQRAVALGYDDVVEVLLRRGAKIADKQVLEESAEKGRERAVAMQQPSMAASYAHIKEILMRL